MCVHDARGQRLTQNIQFYLFVFDAAVAVVVVVVVDSPLSIVFVEGSRW